MIIKLLQYLFNLFTKKPIEEMEYIPTPEVKPDPIIEKTNRERLYEMAKACLLPPHDVSPEDVAPDEYGCVESFDNIYKLTFGAFINGTKNKSTLSTIEAYKYFTTHPQQWEKIDTPLPGDVIICVTGTGNGNLSNGHIGICGKTWIMSNNSYNGNWEANFSYERWRNYYEVKGGFKSHYFRCK
jgi:hypothetical protein